MTPFPAVGPLYFAILALLALALVVGRAVRQTPLCNELVRFATGSRPVAGSNRGFRGWFGGVKELFGAVARVVFPKPVQFSGSRKWEVGSGKWPALLANSASGLPEDAFAGLVNRLSPAPEGFALPEDGFVQLAPLGEFPVTGADGKRRVQVVDGQAVAAMVLNFDRTKPMVVDYDHGSLDPDASSAAAGWVEQLQARPDGLYGKIRWSNRGKEDVEGGAFRFVSPVWIPEKDGDRVRPARLVNVALTNSPNLKTLKPLTNRGTTSDGTVPAGNKEQNKMKNLTKLLGLPDDAEESAVMNRVQELLDGKTALQNRCQALEAEVVEKDLDAFKDVIENREDMKNALLANRDGTLKILKALKKPAAAPAPGKVIPLHNRASAGTPEPGKLTAQSNRSAQQTALVGLIQNREKCDFTSAWNMAKAEKPELFADDTQD